MRKTRILSLLLAAIMTASSLPIVATSVSAAEPQKVLAGVELLTGTEDASNWVGELQAANKSHGTHLRWQTYFSSRTSDLVIKNITAPAAATDYYVKLVVRSQAASGSHGWRTQNGAGQNVNFVVDSAFTGNGVNMTGIASGDNTATIVVKMAMAAGATSCTVRIRGDNTYYNFVPKEIYSVGVYSDAACTNSVWTSTITDTGIGANLEWENNSAAVVNARSFMRVPAIALVNNAPAQTNYNSAAVFNTGKILTPGTYELTFDARQTYFFRESDHNTVEYEYEYQKLLGSKTRAEVVPVKGVRELEKDNGARAVITEDHLNKIDVVNKTYNGSKDKVNIDTDISTNLGNSDASYPVLMTGDTGLSTKLYHVLYKQQYGYRDYNNNTSYPAVNGVRVARSFFAFDSVHTYFHENYRDVKVVLKSGSDTIKSSNVRIDDKWATKKITFTINENTSLSNISFGGTGLAYDNDAFDIDNLSLKMVEPSYTVTNNAIESGLLVGATKNYTTVVDTKIDYTDVTTVPGDYAKNGFITVNRHYWRWSDTETSNGTYPNGALVPTTTNMFWVKLQETASADYVYYVSFDARHSVPTNDKQSIRVAFVGKHMPNPNDSNGANGIYLKDTSTDWNTFTYSINGSAVANTALTLEVRKNWGIHDIPVDFDNVVIWKEPVSGGNGKYDVGEECFYENFNGSDTSSIIGPVNSTAKIYNSESITILHSFEDTYASAAAVEYSGMNNANGVYTFKADVRVPFFWFVDMRDLSWKNNWTKTDNKAEKYLGYNKHTATVSFILEPVDANTSAKVPITVTEEIGYLWSTIEASVIIEEGYKLTGVKVTPTYSEMISTSTPLNFKNVSLVRHGGFVDLNTPIENPNGLLKDATKNYSDANIVGVEYDFEDYTSNNGNVAMNGYITAGRLPLYFRTSTATITRGDKTYSGVQGWASNQDYFTLKLDEDIVPGRAYAASVDVRKSVPDNQTDTKVNFLFENCDPYRPGEYYFPNANEFTSFSRTTVAKSDASGRLIVSVRRGDNAINTPMDFDNLVVWEDTDKDGVLDSDERIIYSENFNDGNKQYIGNAERKLNTRLANGGSFDLGTATLTHNFEETYAKVSGADCALTYSGLNGDSGVYTFSAKMQIPYHYYSDVRNEADWGTPGQVWAKGDGNGEAIFAASEHEVAVKFTLKPNDTNAAYEYKTVTTTVTNAWDDVTASVIIDEGYTLEAVTVTPTFKELAKTAWGADNVTLNFKNVNLTRLGGYVPFTGAIENGELLTGADSNYTEVDTGYDFNADNFEDGKAVKNGYISVSPMPWVYNGTTWVANDILLFKQNSPLLYTVGNHYVVSFSARTGVETDQTVKLQARFYGSNTGMPEITLTNEWQNYIGVWTNNVDGSAGQNINFSININGNKAVDTPIDIDNLVIWEDTNGNMILDDGETIAYSENYNTAGDYVGLSTSNNYICSKFYDRINGSWPTEANSVGASIIAKNERYYNNFTHLFEDNYAYGDLEYSNIKDAGEGVYTFTAEIRLPYHYNYDMTSITSADPAAAQVYYDLNKHDVKVTFALSDGTSITEKSMTLKDAASSDWSSIAAAVVVNEGYTLTAVKAELVSAVNPDTDEAVVPADKQVLSFRNAWLTSEALPIVEAEEGDDDNYLDQIKPTYNDNTIPSTVIEANPDGELYISERPNDGTKTQNFLVIKLDEALPAGEYKISYTIRAEEYVRIRTTINGATESEDTVDQHGNSTKTPSGYFIADGGDIATPCYINNNGVKWLWSGIEAGSEKTFVGKFTTTEKIKYPTITFNRSDVASDGKSALVIDNFRIWYETAGGKEVNVCYEKFDSEDLSIAISGNSAAGSEYTIEHMLPVSHILYTPRDPEETMSVNYDLDLTVDESVEGKYSFKAMVKLAEPTDKAAKARVYFNYSDGTYDVDYIDLSEDWSYIGRSGWLERNPKLESITIEFDSDVPVMLIKPELNIFYKYTYGKPNRGIVMVLLKKLQGKMIDPWKQVGVN